MEQGTTTLSQVMAIVLMARRILLLNALIPVAVIASPLLLNSVIGVFDFLSLGYGFVSLSLTLLLTAFFRKLIATHAPSKKHCDEALRTSRDILPLLSFSLTYIFIRFLLIPIAKTFRMEQNLKIVPSITFYSSLSCGSVMFMLGLSVVFRYIWSPVSVVRSSPFPTISRPLTNSLKATIAYIQEIDVALLRLAGVTKNKIVPHPKQGRRYQSPALTVILFQLLTAGLWGCISGSTLVFTHMIQYAPPFLIILSVTASAVLHALAVCVDGSHELNPRYNHSTLASLFSVPRYVSCFWACGCALLVPAIPLFLLQHNEQHTSWTILFHLSALSILSSIYQIILDSLIRWTIFMPEGDFQQRCSEVIQSSSLSEETVLAVVLETLLLGDMQLLSSIRKPASSVVSIQMEEESRNHTNTLLIGKTMLNRNSYDGGLSQDLQLCLLLESFGGTSYESSTGLLGSSRRHEKQIDRWVGERPRKAIYTSDRYEPVAVPLVRALCAFAGGIGAALSEEIAEPKTSETRNNLDRSSFVSWALPPAAIACSEWAIVAAGRCVLHSIASSKQTDWRCSHLSMFVVVVLHSAYALHSGIESFALHQFRRPVAELPHLMGVINACDAVASTLLEKIQEMDGDRRLDLDLNNSKFLEWYNRIQMTISSRSEMTPVSERKNIVS